MNGAIPMPECDVCEQQPATYNPVTKAIDCADCRGKVVQCDECEAAYYDIECVMNCGC